MSADREAQVAREAAQRDAALGRRLKTMGEGHLGPVIKRWINADVIPTAAIIREAAVSYGEGDMSRFAATLDAPASELSNERPLQALFSWCLRGRSPGRNELGETTHTEDLVLAWMACAINRTAVPPEDSPTVASVLSLTADVLRDTVLGQFIVSIQGASAMQAIREREPQLWQQKKALNRICAQLVSQVKPQLLQEERGERVLKTRGHKKVLSVMDHRQRERMITLRAPDAVDWEVMTLCWQPPEISGKAGFPGAGDAGSHTHKSLWLAFAGVFLAAAQKAGGWFDIAERRQRHGKHVRTSKLLVLSDRAHEAIKRDADRWVSAGFDQEPMVVPPEDGDYLTVKHRKVTGQRSPRGLTTSPEETTAWLEGANALADTPWEVNPYALSGGEEEADAPSANVLRLAAHKRLAKETFYLPVVMDFRGRIYYRPSRVTPQSGDLGKSLLKFPSKNVMLEADAWSQMQDQVIMHMAGLYGGPNKLDKAPYRERLVWWWGLDSEEKFQACLPQADKPLTLEAHWRLIQAEETDSIPVQLDGTCNGLQHLSALFRDEEGARHVNLGASTRDEPPADIYGHVAMGAGQWMLFNFREEPFVKRLVATGMKPDRSLCKTPVMVLPYGGTREAVRMAVKASLLERLVPIYDDPKGDLYRLDPWRTHKENQYEAFSSRALTDHPLFNTDAGQLAALIWDSIAPAIPKAMSAMAVLQAIGAWVGERGLAWRVGVGPEENRLWVVQAKSKASRKQVTMRGFHLPSMVRRLTLNVGTNEIDGKAHRTGIVANFIHSQDAAHLAHAVATFRARGGGCVGSVHDCVLVRPSEASLMGICLRDSFVDLYEEDPLSQPVRIIGGDLDEGAVLEYDNWHALAEAAEADRLAREGHLPPEKQGVEIRFPARGSFDIAEVRQSAWFFS